MNLSEAVNRLKALLEADDATGPHTVDVFVGEPTARMDSDGRAHAYIALYPGLDVPDQFEESACADPGPGRWTVQATCAGGDIVRALRAVDRVKSLRAKTLRGDSGFIRQNGDLGPLRRDTGVSPNRWYLPVDLMVDLPEGD